MIRLLTPPSTNGSMRLTLHTPQATVHSSFVADAWFAWHSMPVYAVGGKRAERRKDEVCQLELNRSRTTGRICPVALQRTDTYRGP
jgi:hypothetical protein